MPTGKPGFEKYLEIYNFTANPLYVMPEEGEEINVLVIGPPGRQYNIVAKQMDWMYQLMQNLVEHQNIAQEKQKLMLDNNGCRF